MNKYIVVFQKAFKSQIIYKSAALSGMVSTILSFGIQICLWKALLGTELCDGNSFYDMILYVLINLFVSTLTRANVSSTIENAILDGSISTELLKPISYKYYLLSNTLGKNSYNLIIRVLPVTLIGIVMLVIGNETSISLIPSLLFIIAVILGILIMFEITYLFGLLAFKIQRCWYLRFYVDAFTKFFGGTTVPLWFYPSVLQKASYFLPFRYITFEPINIILSRITLQQSCQSILIAAGWLIILNLLDSRMWNYATRNLSINGG